MRFLIRHPIVVVFLIGVVALSYAVFNKYQSPAGQNQNARFGPGPGGTPPVAVHVVGPQRFIDKVESIGTATANESVNLTAKVTDTVSRVNFTDGQFVDAGDILVELTNRAETARLSEAQTSFDEATRQYERLENLLANNLISETDLDEARARADTAKARLEGVIAAMDDRLIRAPFAGNLGFRNVSEGTLLSPSTVITTLDDTSVIKVDFTVPEVYLADVNAGQEITARSVSYSGTEFDGVVRTVGSRVDPVTRSVSIRAHIDNESRLLRPGMLLTVALQLKAADVLAVPEQALVPRQGKQFVFVVSGEQNRIEEVEVVVGRRQPGLAEIVAGLSPGQLVVTEGMSQLRPGQEVQIIKQTENEYLRPSEDGRPANS